MHKPPFFLSGPLDWGGFKIAGLYLLFGSLWILFSDRVAERISMSKEMLANISLYKGWGFVIVTALLLYGLIRRHTSRVYGSQKQLQVVIDALPILISYIDKNQRYQFANQAYEEWFGEKAQGKHVEEVVGQATYQKASKYVDKVLQGETVTYETEILDQDGRERFVSATYVPNIDTKGRVKGFFTLVHDISEQKETREKLRQWADAFESCAHGIAIGDPHTNRIVVCNPGFASLHKCRVEDIEGTAILSLYAPSEYEYVRRNMQRADQIGHASFEAHMLRKDGSIFPVQMDVVSVLDEEGELLHRVATAQDISERKSIDEKLRESETKYRALVEHLPAITYISEPDQYVGVSYISPQIESFGFHAKEWLADPEFWFRHIHPEDRELVESELQKFQGDTESFTAEYRLLLPNGETRWVHDESVRVKDQDGKTILKQGFMLDVTERKQAEEVLHESEERYRMVSELTSDYAYKDRVDADGSIVAEWITESFTRITGYTLKETFAPDFWQRLVHPEDMQILSEHIQAVLSGQSHTMEVRVITKSKQVRWLKDYSNPMWDSNHERVVGLFGAVQDITQYKQAEGKLLIQAHWLEQIHDAVITADENFVITAWNPAAERVYGWKAEEVIGKTSEEVFRSEFFSKTRAEAIQQLKESGELSAEITQLRKDGSRIYVETRTVTLRDENGHIIGHLSVNRDVTGRRQTEEKLRKNEERYRYLFENNPHPMWVYDRKTLAFLDVNEAAIAKYGYSRQEFLNLTITDIRPPQDVDRLMTNLAQPRQPLEHSEGWKHILKDGTIIDVEITSHTVETDGHESALVVAEDVTERKRAEAAVLESELRYHRVLDTMMEGCQIIASDWSYVYVNPVVAEQGKRNPEELLGRTMMEVFPGIENTELFAVLRQCMEERVSRRMENQFVFPNGGVGWFELSIQPVEEGIFILSTDITERKQAEEYLRRFELLSENSRDIILFIDRKDGRILEANAAALQAYGYRRGEMLALTIQDLRADDTLGLTAEQMDKADAGGFLFETVHRRQDGITFPVEVSSQGATIGEVRTLISIIRDITERKQIESALQKAHDELERKVEERTAALSQANALLQALLDYVPDHIYFKDLQSRFIRNSRSQANSLGLSDPAQAVGKTDFDFFPHAAKAFAEEQEVMRSGKPRIDFEEWVVWPNGKETWVSTTKVPLRNSDGETIGIFGISRDITERKRAEQDIRQLNSDLENQAVQLQTANKELEAFSYSVSHDLRAPLRAIDGYTRILVEDYEAILDAEGKRVCGVISAEARRMGQLIDDLLAFSRLGRKEMFSSHIDMKALAVSVLNELIKEEDRERIDFKIAKLPSVKADASLIRQVWMNLLSNAIKFTSKKERAVIEVGSKSTKDELIYYVGDTGAGFDMEYANKLFGVFQRLHSESEFEGTGVGLAIVQRIVRRHGGRIWAEGEVDKGATFYFALPRKEHHHE